jgi:hypothetical protein
LDKVQEDLINIILLQETQHKVVFKDIDQKDLININLLQETQDNIKIKDHKIQDIKEDKDQAPNNHILIVLIQETQDNYMDQTANTHNLIVLIQEMFSSKMAIILIISEEEIT